MKKKICDDYDYDYSFLEDLDLPKEKVDKEFRFDYLESIPLPLEDYCDFSYLDDL